jgi:hypothetical protein
MMGMGAQTVLTVSHSVRADHQPMLPTYHKLQQQEQPTHHFLCEAMTGIVTRTVKATCHSAQPDPHPQPQLVHI